ncbi:hypothetical protein M3J09_008153 [Ascochyta lentis]
MQVTAVYLWLVALVSLCVPTLACRQRYYHYQKDYKNCNEGLVVGVKDLAEKECAKFAKAFIDMNPSINHQFGRDITSGLGAIGELGPENPNCITLTCIVTAWRYHEWQNDMEHRSLPRFNGWRYESGTYGPGTVSC